MILIVDDDHAVVESISLLLKQNGYKTCSAYHPDEAKDILDRDPISLVILDMNFTVETSGEDGLIMLKEIKSQYPGIPVILITAWGHMSLAIEGMKAGAVDFINKPWDNEYLLQSVGTALRIKETENETKSTDRRKIDRKYDFEKIIGSDPKLTEVLQVIGRISKTNASVLITGESGTGKELIAEAIHHNSLRKDEAFIKVNLGGISSSLFESEMFGHVKGAFTDAYFDRIGRFEQAHKGTIFLDELGELDLSSQVKLLRVLQERKFEVLGSSQTKSVDVRVICATNKDLLSLVSEGKFREDLLYRINLITVHLPPLRERKKDIPILVDHFLKNLKEIYQRPDLVITLGAIEWLKELAYTGNIRELKNLVERTILVNESNVLDIQHFTDQLDFVPSHSEKEILPEVGKMSLEEIEIEMIKRAMNFHRNKITEVAKALGISRNALYRRLEKYNISHET